MNAIKKTGVELVLLGALSAALAFGVNQFRTSRSLKLSKNYFAKSAEANPSGEASSARPNVRPSDAASASEQPTKAVEGGAAPAVLTAPTAAAPTAAKKLDHPYQEIDFEQVADVFHDPATKQGLNIFVDARKHEFYDEGHIPGALHCDPYEAEKTIDEVLARANGVERVIVYCGGGDCEDSIYMCRELVEAGVPEDSIFLYPGGWTEWTARNMPAEVGHAEE